MRFIYKIAQRNGRCKFIHIFAKRLKKENNSKNAKISDYHVKIILEEIKSAKSVTFYLLFLEITFFYNFQKHSYIA